MLLSGGDEEKSSESGESDDDTDQSIGSLVPELVMKYIKHLKAHYKIDFFPNYFSKHPLCF